MEHILFTKDFSSAEVFFSWEQSGRDQAPSPEDWPDWTQGPGDNRRQGKLWVSIRHSAVPAYMIM